MSAYYQWLKGVRRRAAVRWRCWRWVETAVSAVPAKRFGGIVAALATGAVVGATAAVAARHASACEAGDGLRVPARLRTQHGSLPEYAHSRAEGETAARAEPGRD